MTSFSLLRMGEAGMRFAHFICAPAADIRCHGSLKLPVSQQIVT